MSRRSPYVIELSSEDRAVLEERARAYTAAFAVVIRAKIVLLAAQGLANVRIAEQLGVHVDTVGVWRRRFFESGVAGLNDRERCGRPRSFSPQAVAAEVRQWPASHPSSATCRCRGGAPRSWPHMRWPKGW
jgi:hypothetical protein